jgi:DUF2934 family protein
MKTNEPLFPQRDGFSTVATDRPTATSAKKAITTRDHDVIRQWADRHQATPATGIATESGPATVRVSDGGAVVRFNFPAAARFRPISWEEWFALFDQRRLTFVYEEDVEDRAHELAQARGGAPGHELEDWSEAKRQLAPAGSRSGRYRFIVEDDQSEA